jgi:type VI secretion system protein ImpA
VPGEVKPTRAGILQGLREAVAADPRIVPAMRAVDAAVTSIERTVSARVGIAGPDFRPLSAITSACAHAADELEGLASAPTDVVATPIANAGRAATAASGAIESRDDVVRILGQVCDWVERHEPSNPAPLLIRRAQRLMSKSFLDLVKDLAPQGLTQIEQIAGVTES